MRQPAYSEGCYESSMLLVGMFIGAFLTGIIVVILSEVTRQPDMLACRDGKLYEVSYEQNITIYDPTFDDCEETR